LLSLQDAPCSSLLISPYPIPKCLDGEEIDIINDGIRGKKQDYLFLMQ
jgi:hypothetical protein